MHFSAKSRLLWLRVLLAAVAASLLAGCAVEETDAVSNLPWNRPQRWEGQGMMGPMLQNR
jgi:type IV pilus biogenesis protein CpaD/CtpE